MNMHKSQSDWPALKHSRLVYWADFAAYGLALFLLAAWLVRKGPHDQWPSLLLLVVAGVAVWSLVEYGMHRFVLHGLEPFQSWHAMHHDQPGALISTPTVISAILIAALVFFPAMLLAGPWRAGALTLGLTAGYLGYALTHHATHHWRAGSVWLKQRKSWHAQHHHARGAGCYGVSSSLWDRVFKSTLAPRPPR
jgi:sterol desaturase/sphingolipid hydroxylase (fatty acid hydroxylase superfamily)